MMEAQQLTESEVKDQNIDAYIDAVDGWLAKTGGYAKDMSLRDYFAANTMQVVYDGIGDPLELSKMAYEMADAMLEARNAA